MTIGTTPANAAPTSLDLEISWLDNTALLQINLISWSLWVWTSNTIWSSIAADAPADLPPAVSGLVALRSAVNAGLPLGEVDVRLRNAYARAATFAPIACGLEWEPDPTVRTARLIALVVQATP